VLPLGTFTWTVKACKEGPLLCYDVHCAHCKDTIHVFPYMQPHGTLICYSPLATLVPHYNALLSMREFSAQAMSWNARPRMALEEQEKARACLESALCRP
jgi:hypothetical protein